MPSPNYRYEQPEKFGSSLTSKRPWNYDSLRFVERLNGRAAMIGFVTTIIIERLTGLGIISQLRSMLGWYLDLGVGISGV